MSASVVIVGLGEWERFTKPCIDSLLENNASFQVIVVDNGSDPAYEAHKPCYRIVHNPVKGSYAQGLNMGYAETEPNEWTIFTNNDVLFHEPIFHRLHSLKPDNLYGFMLYDKVFTRPYLSGWCLFVHDALIDRIGLFDETFAPMWFEDADYSYRAVDAGFGLVELDRLQWGIEHLERKGERGRIMNDKLDARKANRARLEKKHHVKPV